MTMEIETNEFIPRDYQSEILEIAVQGITIVYLPTGSGKTYIAIMLINRLSREIIRPNNKITVFLVNTVPLVEQNYLSIKRHTVFEIGRFSGEQNIDASTNEQWYSELMKYQVIVFTAQIFLDIVMHGQFSIDKVNLIIFDECHQAVENQPMRQIMKLFENVPVDKQARVVRLTATLLNRNCSPLKVQKVVRSLEMTFQGKVASIQDMAQIIEFSTNPEERITYFQSMVPDKILQKAINMVIDIDDFVSSVKWPRSKLLATLVVHMEMLGIFAWKSTFASVVSTERMKRQAKYHKDSLTYRVLTAITTKLCTVMALLEQTMAGYSNVERIFKVSSPQVLMLIEILRAFRATSTNSSCGIVFVRQRFTAKVLFSVVKALADCSDEFSYIRTDFMVGSNANLGDKTTRELPYWDKINKRIIRNFYDGVINLLIASNVAEEGIDIARCTLVVKFDRPMDYRSYIQSKGRARAGDSLHVIMVPVEENKYEENYHTYKAVQEKLLQVRSTYAQFT